MNRRSKKRMGTESPRPGWILFVGQRYIKSKREDRRVTPSRLSIVGIAVGVIVLVSVMSVMNGLQLGFIEDILEINSYHLRVEIDESKADSVEKLADEYIEALPEIKGTALFRDSQTLVQGEFSDYRSVMVRGISEESALSDTGLMEHVHIEEGDFQLEKDGMPGVVIGAQLAGNLGVRPGDTLQMVSMRGNSFAQLRPQHTSFVVTGIFRSGYYQYDSSFCFVGLRHIGLIDTSSGGLTLGIKIENRFGDRHAAAKVEKLLEKTGGTAGPLVSWREYNRAFFGALRMEKLTMSLLLGLIFLVVAVNIKNSLERSVMEKKEDIGLLRAVGAASSAVRAVFIFEGWIIGLIGILIGLPLGMILSININQVFRMVEALLNGVAEFVLRFTSFHGAAVRIRMFSPQTFYLRELPVRIMWVDVFGIAVFAVAVAVLAAYAASRRIAEFNPAEILRNE